MLIEDLMAELREPVSGMRMVIEKLSGEISENRKLFWDSDHKKEFDNLKGLCSVLLITHEHLVSVLKNYQKELNTNFNDLIETEI